MNDSPPRPPDWNKTMDDLCAEIDRGERTGIYQPEIDWAVEYERDQIPAHMRFPRKGDVYEAIADTTVRYHTVWTAPFTGGGEGLLKRGERVFVKDVPPNDPKPISVYAVAVDYDRVHERMVPTAERAAPKYGGFYLPLKTVELNQKFRLVHEE